jgi:3D (Asp-Asp-Asp) domain-containing protein
MNELILLITLLGSFPVTSYRSVHNQTDNSPFITSTGEHVNKMGCAVSQDLLKSKTVHYGDLIYIEDLGFYRINDTMNIRIKRQFDVWVGTLAEEKAHDKKFGKRKLKVWLIKKKV